MGRASTRQNKTPYQLAREELGLSRERAAELLETIPAERIERIESERSLPRPDEVLRMASLYPARAIGREAERGHLRRGARADAC